MITCIYDYISKNKCIKCIILMHEIACYQVHCDVWGPAPHTSPTGGKYYMVFIDDYTRASWTYILKSRNEVLSRVQHFLLEIITQYETVVKILRTDNALEFTQKAIEELCLGHGIVHQTTCPYTSQQNGVAERKHRHLLDMVRTLLLAMRVPQYLWCEAVLTATYLVNRLPSAALGGAIPLQRLTPAALHLSRITPLASPSWLLVHKRVCLSATLGLRRATVCTFQIGDSTLLRQM